ncbi:helix-turn-helix domain-containing protein, partial [Adlercreutzia mucosicola]|uniref:helix-turn-helix domain-containing protein n=3 Tax=Adlercreutzia TaxID=447020 RepID=UPI00146C417A
MRHGTDVRVEAVRCFEAGYAEKAVGRMLGISVTIARKWLYAYRALGKEALFVTGHNTYPHELKVEAAKAVIEGRMTKPAAMKAYGLRSKT